MKRIYNYKEVDEITRNYVGKRRETVPRKISLK